MKSPQDQPVIFLFGPTAVGKTQILADYFARGFSSATPNSISHGFEVVNADSVQVYKHLDIGSAKADSEITSIIPHHLIDLIEPWETWNVADFITHADAACKEIWSRGNIPIISGGTAFYFKHFLYGLSPAPKSDPDIRATIDLYIRDQGLSKAYHYLTIVDPISAAKINPNDRYRISRALEVFRASGRPLSSFATPTSPRAGLRTLILGLRRDKADLRARITQRVDLMLKNGLITEIRKLVQMGASLSWQSMSAIGYHEFLVHTFTGEISSTVRALDALTLEDLAQIKSQIINNTIHYAKRQMTFFKSFPNVHWLDPSDLGSLPEILSDFLP